MQEIGTDVYSASPQVQVWPWFPADHTNISSGHPVLAVTTAHSPLVIDDLHANTLYCASAATGYGRLPRLRRPSPPPTKYVSGHRKCYDCSGAGAGRADHAHARQGFIHGNMAKPFGTWSPVPSPQPIN